MDSEISIEPRVNARRIIRAIHTRVGLVGPAGIGENQMQNATENDRACLSVLRKLVVGAVIGRRLRGALQPLKLIAPGP